MAYPKDVMDYVRERSPVRPTPERFGSSYVVRLSYQSRPPDPLGIVGVQGAIDMHCHASAGEDDQLGVAKKASLGRMGGILYKSIGGGPTPAAAARQVGEELKRWCDEHDLEPCQLWAGCLVCDRGRVPMSDAPRNIRENLDDGVAAVWMPVFNHANTLATVATRAADLSDPAIAAIPPTELPLHPRLPFEEAKRIGLYLLDARGKLLPEMLEVLRIVADYGAVLSFGHITRQEQWAIVEELDKLAYKKAFIDHPFSPFIGLTVEEMKQFAAAGLYLNFTYDELSPLLGVDPLDMFQAIAEVGPEHVLLSSDSPGSLFPDAVESIRLMRAYAAAFNMSPEDIYQMSCVNPARLLGVPIKPLTPSPTG